MQLTRRRIIASAIALIERNGGGPFTMRQLATELGISLAVLYHHAPSRSGLLDEMAADLLAGLTGGIPADGWARQIAGLARSFRQAVAAHPRCSLLLARRSGPAFCSSRPVTAALASLREAGFGELASQRIARAVTAYILGSQLCQTELAGDPCDHLSTGQFPRLRGLAGAAAAPGQEADFEFVIDLLLRGAACWLAASSSPQAAP
jgi:AcrR family transcriptional regulator